MSFLVGFVFTGDPIKNLQEKGFVFHEDQSSMDQGYRSFTAVFPDSSGFQIREILDENLYRQFHQIEHFEPTVIEAPLFHSRMNQPNSVLGVVESIVPSKIEASELKTYLEIRKPFLPWALLLKCQSFDLFCQRGKPDRLFQWQAQKIAMIHLGPNCFDLLVRQDL